MGSLITQRSRKANTSKLRAHETPYTVSYSKPWNDLSHIREYSEKDKRGKPPWN